MLTVCFVGFGMKNALPRLNPTQAVGQLMGGKVFRPNRNRAVELPGWWQLEAEKVACGEAYLEPGVPKDVHRALSRSTSHPDRPERFTLPSCDGPDSRCPEA